MFLLTEYRPILVKRNIRALHIAAPSSSRLQTLLWYSTENCRRSLVTLIKQSSAFGRSTSKADYRGSLTHPMSQVSRHC